MVHPETVVEEGVNEFRRIEDRLLGKAHNRYWILTSDPTKEMYSNGTAAQAGFNTLLCHNFETGKKQTYYHGDDITFQEPCFVPRSDDAPPEDGYIVIMADLYRENRSHLLLFEAQNIEKGPIAEVKLPLKLLDGLHGSWVDGKDIALAVEAGAKST
ncbi:hypothetical protein yc1106_00012 [Curvularia clavata]|uniref:Uncharacterized protein n=1 Tax=Curvularia clavata TaxID=95742 RepID=A0A9Q8Z2F6_CURCL|nr:hypothetical protein yc1106_00012 [Curvularia clavata]